ncbi:hypothetical protein F5Y04DRAFT_190572 [Hypomontagnella monticulosa]|nr:hypothetical protein F5Y04DRAFT_190572 [Hypomontagnella monticulosa]
MASGDSGDAFAHQGGAPTWNAGGWNGASENQSSNNENSDQHAQVPIDQAPPSPGDASDDEDGGEYDPESVTITTLPALPAVDRPASNSPLPSKKPKTAGGFIVDNSSDEEDDATPPAPAETSNSLKPIPSETQPRPFNNSPLQQTTISRDVVNDGPTQVSSGPVPETASNATPAAATRSRLPTDFVGILEDRIKEDPRGDLEAWLALIDEQKRRHNIEDTRAVYERFLKVFPQAAEIWVAYVDMELSLDNSHEAESIFTRMLLEIPNVQLWTSYLNYIRRRNDLSDPTGRARQTISQAYEFVLGTIGQDRDAGSLWQDYIQFIKTGPGQIGGSGWQDQQKMDVLRKAYQRAVSIPMPNVNALWKEYDLFEMGLNKMTGRKFIQERSPSYMSARSANTHLENITRGLRRTTLPRLPPAPGFEGDQEYLEQVRLWKAWIAWEKSDPLDLARDDPDTYRQRILLVYKQALMALRFWPEMWVDAAEWCFDNNVVGKDGQDIGLKFLTDGLDGNPESPLLALKNADRIESTQPPGEDDAGKAALVAAVRKPCDRALDTLYDMVKKLKDQEATAITKIEKDAALDTTATTTGDEDADEDEGEIQEKPSAEAMRNLKIKAIRDGFAVQIQMLSQHISYLWIALARIHRRIQGQGSYKSTPAVGLRGIFAQARSRGRLTSDVYVETSHMEWNIYGDEVATRIYDRGSKLYPDQEDYVVEYLKHLHKKRDFTNARVVFSQTVQRFRAKPELIPKLKPIYAYFHNHEARFGELAQVRDLEKQMGELFPEDPSLAHFAARYTTDKFNPVTARVIVSPARQMRPKSIMQSIEQLPTSARSSPHPAPQMERTPQPQFYPAVNSPKRPFQPDDQDEYPPRKVARGASPLKGAAGRRLDQQRRAQQGQSTSSYTAAPTPLPRDVTFFLGLIPPAEAFRGNHFNTAGVVRLIQNTTVPSYNEWRAQGEGASSHAHTRQASSEYQPYPYSSNRDSPGPSGRPASPFNGMNRGMAQASAPYRNSPLRPGSSGSYEPPPAIYQAGASGFNPLAQNPVPGNAGFNGWQGGYAPPTQYNTAPTQQHPQQYGGYY